MDREPFLEISRSQDNFNLNAKVVKIDNEIPSNFRSEYHTYVSFFNKNSFIYCTENKGMVIFEDGKKINEFLISNKF